LDAELKFSSFIVRMRHLHRG